MWGPGWVGALRAGHQTPGPSLPPCSLLLWVADSCVRATPGTAGGGSVGSGLSGLGLAVRGLCEGWGAALGGSGGSGGQRIGGGTGLCRAAVWGPDTQLPHMDGLDLVTVPRCSHSNRVTGVYELSLCHVADAGSPGRHPPCSLRQLVAGGGRVWHFEAHHLGSLSHSR